MRGRRPLELINQKVRNLPKKSTYWAEKGWLETKQHFTGPWNKSKKFAEYLPVIGRPCPDVSKKV